MCRVASLLARNVEAFLICTFSRHVCYPQGLIDRSRYLFTARPLRSYAARTASCSPPCSEMPRGLDDVAADPASDLVGRAPGASHPSAQLLNCRAATITAKKPAAASAEIMSLPFLFLPA